MQAQVAAERSDAPRCASPSRWREPPAMGAERASHGGGCARTCLPAPASEARSERQRAQAPGIVTGTAKTAQRASWSRAGRSRARRNRARRPVRRTGRASLPSDRNSGRQRAVIDYGRGRLTRRRDRGVVEQSAKRWHAGGVGCDDGKSERRGGRRWRRAEDGTTEDWRKDRRAAGDGASAPSRPRGRAGGVRRDGGAGSGSGAGAKRRRRDARHRARRKKGGPIPRGSKGPARTGGRGAALTRRRGGPGCRGGAPCRPGCR